MARFFITIFILLIFSSFIWPQVSHSEPKDAKSHNHIPYPYPQSNKEILADLLHALKRNTQQGEGFDIHINNKDVDSLASMEDMVKKGDPAISLIDIIKVQNNMFVADRDCLFHIVYLKPATGSSIRFTLHANGSYMGSILYGKKSPYIPLNKLGESLYSSFTKKGITVGMDECMNFQYIAFDSPHAHALRPAIGVKLKNGREYYILANMKIYEAIRFIDVKDKKTKQNLMNTLKKLNPATNPILNDTHNNRVIVLQETAILE